MAMRTAAILVRPTPGYSAEAQRATALAHAAKDGLAVSGIYVDDGRRPRRGRQAVMRAAGTGFDVLIATGPEMLGSTMNEVLVLLATLNAKGARLMAAGKDDDALARLQEAVPILLEAQAALRREAIQRGRERARLRGVKFGRPAIPVAKIAQVRAALAAGVGVRAAARAAGVSAASVSRLRDDQLKHRDPAIIEQE